MAAALLGACGSLLPATSWTVEVANTDRPLIVSIATDRAAWMWLVPAGEHLVLLREPQPIAGSIELIDPLDCALYDTASLLPSSFTIVPIPVEQGPTDFRLDLRQGAAAIGPVSTDYTASCSG